MKRGVTVLLRWQAVLGFVLITVSAACAGQDVPNASPWETFGVRAGYFISAMDTTIRIGAGLGIDIDAEEALGLEASNSVFRIGAMWRFSRNRRHCMDLSWFSLNRRSGRKVVEDITFENNDGEEVTIPAGTRVDTVFDLDIYSLNYSYSFIQDDRVNLAARIGLYIMPIRIGIETEGLLNEQADADFTAPLPELGLGMDVVLKPRWFLRSGIKVFYVEYENFKGSLLSVDTAVEYQPWKHVGIGLGYDSMTIKVEAQDEDWPEIDLEGKIRLSYAGLQLYLRYLF